MSFTWDLNVLESILVMNIVQKNLQKIEVRIGLVAAGFRAQGAKFGWTGCHGQSSAWTACGIWVKLKSGVFMKDKSFCKGSFWIWSFDGTGRSCFGCRRQEQSGLLFVWGVTCVTFTFGYISREFVWPACLSELQTLGNLALLTWNFGQADHCQKA